MPDACFTDPRLAVCYDVLDPDHSDLVVYAEIVDELGARSALDVGCGTGTFACMLARPGFEVVGVDPAAASLDVARQKPGADLVRWIHGGANEIGALGMDLAFMTGNVAQVFVGDDDWQDALDAVWHAVRPRGSFVFETRVLADEAWRRWTKDQTFVRAEVPGIGDVQHWVEVSHVDGALVTFEGTYVLASGDELTSTSTLRFRTCEELSHTLAGAGFDVREIRDAPDRPGREHVFVAIRS